MQQERKKNGTFYFIVVTQQKFLFTPNPNSELARSRQNDLFDIALLRMSVRLVSISS